MVLEIEGVTEADWLSQNGIRQLLIIEECASIRKIRLIVAAYVRLAQTFPDVGEDAIHCDDVIESLADHPRSWEEILSELRTRPGYSWRFAHVLAHENSRSSAKELRKLISLWPLDPVDPYRCALELLHDVVGNPFRQVTFDTCWRTSTVLALAQGIYDSRDFSSMAILADALQDAGCENAEILNHCRDQKAAHVRGCWPLDLVLAKQ